CYLQVGQQFSIRNSIAGEIGTRDIQMDYISLPIALKLHVNDLAFFRLSAVLGLNVNYLLNGRETISHAASKVTYPAGITIPKDPGYVAVYDGVFVPAVDKLEYVSNDKFNSIQLFAALGLRSDFDLNDDWSINFDGRANFGLFDSRQTSYVNQLKNPSGGADFNGNPGAPDLPGQRREIYLAVSVGISKIITTKSKFKTKRTSITNRGGNNAPKPRGRKPKG
ncbi:MAG: outer membrane beta-barrel protein, partial [Cyclobacteriaceae bacterium]|nr:outer membrane beta-barrel protein [Cyclobacteriaceae bacterium]